MGLKNTFQGKLAVGEIGGLQLLFDDKKNEVDDRRSDEEVCSLGTADYEHLVCTLMDPST